MSVPSGCYYNCNIELSKKATLELAKFPSQHIILFILTLYLRGDFYITEHDVRFLSENRTILLQYPSISVHALSRDSGSFPHRPSVFMLINEESIEQVDEPRVR